VEIVGEDAEGALLLAVLLLPDPEGLAGEGTAHLAVPLEGGQTETVAIALEAGRGGEARAYVIRVGYTAPAAEGPDRPPPETPPGDAP
jgi:hypothetical protein